MALTEQDAQELLAFLRTQVSQSRFAALDVTAMELVTNEQGLRRVIRYLDVFVQMASERSSRASREIEEKLGQYLKVEDGSFEGVKIELPLSEREVRQTDFLSLRDLDDSEDLVAPLRQLSGRLKEEMGPFNGFETGEN